MNPKQIEQIDDSEFNALKAEKRHNDLLQALKTLTLAVQADSEGDGRLMQFIQKQSQALESIISKIQSLSQPPRVSVNQESVVSAIAEVAKELKSNLQALQVSVKPQERTSEWEFTVNRNPYGYIQSVNAKAKK